MLIIQEISQKIHANKTRLLIWLDALLLLVLITFILSGITLAPFHGDESTYIWMSRDYDKIFKQGDLGAVRFNPESDLNVTEQRLRLSIGSVLGVAIGAARDITNTDINMNNKWNWGQPWDENILNGNMPSPQLLTLARACSALMGALGVVFFFLTARQLFSSRLVAWAAILLLATHGDVLLNFRRAMQEGPKFLFLFITLYIGTHILQSLKNYEVRRFLYVLIGAASGFSLAAKQDTAPVLVAIYLALALGPILNIHKEKGEFILINILYLGGATILAFASFLALMPLFWGWWETVLSLIGISSLLFLTPAWKVDKAARFLALASCILVIGMSIASPSQWRRFFAPITGMLEVRETLLDSQVQNRIRYNLPYLDTAESKASFLLMTTFTSHVMYMEVTSFDVLPINKQIAAYEVSIIHGRMGSPFSDGCIAVLFIIGMWVLIRRFGIESLMIISLLIISAVFLFISVPLPWQRYFLIMQIPYSLIAGAGAGQLWKWGRKLVESRVRVQN